MYTQGGFLILLGAVGGQPGEVTQEEQTSGSVSLTRGCGRDSPDKMSSHGLSRCERSEMVTHPP